MAISLAFRRAVEAVVGRMWPRFVLLPVPLLSTAWDGDIHSDTAATLIDLSAVFGVPAGAKAVALKAGIRDSGSAGTRTYAAFGPAGGQWALVTETGGMANNSIHEHSAVVPCDANGDIYYTIEASGVGTLEVWLSIWGYWL